MPKFIQNEQDLLQVRSRFQSEGKFIVKYEEVERNVNEFMYGDAKLTPTILSDLNNLVEGIILDDCIEFNFCDSELKDITPLTECILKVSDYIIRDDVDEEVDKESDKYVEYAGIQFNIELQRKIHDLVKAGRIEKVHLDNSLKRVEKILKLHPNFSEIHPKYIELISSWDVGKWEDYIQCLNFLTTSLPSDIIKKLNKNAFNFYKEINLSFGAYDLSVSSDKIELVLQKLVSGELIDPVYECVKNCTLAYQQYYGNLNMSVRFPAQLRFPLMHGLNIPKLTYDLYRQIANIHEVSVDLLIKFSGAIQIYIPPLPSILLNRCNKKADFGEKLIELREEFQSLRTSVQKYIKDLREQRSLKEQLEVVRGMHQAFDLLKNKLTEGRTSIIYQSWKVVKEGEPLKILTGALNLLVEKGKMDSIIRQVHPFVDLWNMSLEVKNYGRLLEKVFGKEKINYKSFRKSKQLIKTVDSFLFPLGRER